MNPKISHTSEPVQVAMRQTMRALFEQGPQSSSAIFQTTGLSKEAVSKSLASLEKAHLIELTNTPSETGGNNSQNYQIAGNTGVALAMDVGGTKIDATLLDLSGATIARGRAPTDKRGKLHVIGQMADIGQQLLTKAGFSKKHLKACVAGVPGVPDPSNGSVRLASNIKGWDMLDVSGELASQLGCQVHLENDVNLAALGEQYFNEGGDLTDFAFLNVGTGISMGLVLEGRLIKGTSGAAGEIGFLPIVPASGYYAKVPEGQLERAVGSHGLLARYNTISSHPAENVAEVFERLEQADPKADLAIKEASAIIATAMLCVTAILDLQTFVLGGSIGMQAALRFRIERALQERGAKNIKLLQTKLPNTAGSLGAQHLAFRHMAEDVCHFMAAGEPEPHYRASLASINAVKCNN